MPPVRRCCRTHIRWGNDSHTRSGAVTTGSPNVHVTEFDVKRMRTIAGKERADMMMNKWLTLTASLLLAIGPMAGALAASPGMGHSPCPAAPQVANEILKSHDLGNRLDTGETDHRGRPIAINLVSEVAREMGHRATFPAWDSNGQWDGVTYIDKCDVDAYYDAVYNFLVYLGADLPPAQAAITAIEVKTPPDKVVYTEGESLDLAGLVVTLTRSDEATEDVAFEDFGAAGITTDKADGEPLALTDTVVTITHTRSGLSTTLAITVQPPLFGPDPASQPGVTAFYGTPAAGMMVFLDVGQFDITAYREGEVDVFLVGGGGGASGAGGGGGYTATFLNVNTAEIPGNFDGLIGVTVGAGGAGQSRNVPGGAGGYSRLGTDETYQADGGGGGKASADILHRPGGDGGSGGAGYRSGNRPGAAGGSDGSDGREPEDGVAGYDGAGSGQGTTTREWGDPEHPNLYAGGGGGGTGGIPGPGGAGGGGDGNGENGTDGLGGGGGGSSGSAGDGGSGIVLIRWGGYAEDYLIDLQVDLGDLTPAFDATVNSYHYNAEFVDENVAVTATLSGPQASLTIDGQPALSGEPVTVSLGDPGSDTEIEVLVTTADGAKTWTYTLTVSRPSGFGLFGSYPEAQPGVTAFYGTPEAGVMVLKEDRQYAITAYQQGEVDVFLVGGGGGGSGAGGGGGYTATYLNVHTTSIPGFDDGQIAVTVGEGGAGQSRNVSGGAGGPSRLGTDKTYQADGGQGGLGQEIDVYRVGGDGGSGGAGYRTSDDPGGHGGFDGSDGIAPDDGLSGRYDGSGRGQGTTTREWGDPEHPNLYAGGGGGGTQGTPGKGGAGGGGDGNGENGTDGLGGGGGGSSGTAGDGGSGIVLIRWGGYAEDYLSDLQVDHGVLTPAFDATVTAYEVEVEHATEEITITATLTGPQATLTIDGLAAASGEARTVPLGEEGTDTVIEVAVTTADGGRTKVYTVTVSRAINPSIHLSDLSVDPGILSPTFNAFVTAYDVDVDFDVEAVAVTATLWDPASSLTIDGAGATSGEATTVSLGDPGTETEIDIVVTTEDGSDSETYTLTVTRAHDPDAPTIQFIWVTDVHLNLARESTWDTLEWFVSEVNQKSPDFVLNTGDNVDGKIDRETSLQEIDQYVQRWSQISPDILTDHAMGNRDVASWYETDDEDWITAFDQAGIDSLGGSPYADRPVIAGSKLTTTHLITDPFNVRVFVLNVYREGYSNSDAKAWVKQVLAGDTDLQAVLFFAHSNTFFSSAAAALAESGLEDVTATYMHGHNHTGDPTLDEESSTANLKRYSMHGLNDSNGRYAEATIWPTGAVEFTPVVAP